MESFLFQATLYLTAMVIAVPIASRLGLGSVLGYLLIGLLIGPVLGLVGSEMRDLQSIAEFGVVMLLFLIGLELEPRTLWAMRDKLVGLGGMQILVTILLITTVNLAMGQSGRIALALGMIFALSSTAIVLQSMSEKRLMQTAGGRAAFAVLLMQDIAVIPMLALMPLLALPGARAVAQADEGGSAGHLIQNLPAWGVTLATLGAVAAVVIGGHYLVRPLFRYVHAARLREINTALALMIVVGIASLMTLVGLSPALGTCLAGVVLADSEFRHELESDIEPFKGLLLGMFFITVGAGMNFAPFLANPANIIALVLALVAAKAGVLFVLGRLFGLRGKDQWLFSLGLAQAGEFGFVLVSFALGQRILPEVLAQKVLLIVALSMLITPALFIALDWLGKQQKAGGDAAPPDAIDDRHPIIIAGVGRFGQVVNRMVTMSGFKTTVLDSDLKTIQLMRKFGFKAYFGDPTRPDLLASAGVASARVLVVCLDDYAAATRLVAYARRLRPDLHIVARARDREHVFELYRAGANDIVREMFDSSLRAARYVLENVGLSEFEAAEAFRIFYKLDREGVRDLARVWKPGVPIENNAAYMELSRALNRDLEAALMQRENSAASELPDAPHDQG
ncbi:MAG: cation:proton antiporter [Pseudorhodobacter sp.]|nr:cation:proton antiporter [Pseudorhodobacter sp.]